MGTLISAEVVLKSQSGESLLETDALITSENIQEFAPAPKTVEDAVSGLQALGFRVAPSDLMLTITGKQADFEAAFQVKLVVKKDPSTGGSTVEVDGEPRVPATLQGTVETVVFPEPPEFFP